MAPTPTPTPSPPLPPPIPSPSRPAVPAFLAGLVAPRPRLRPQRTPRPGPKPEPATFPFALPVALVAAPAAPSRPAPSSPVSPPCPDDAPAAEPDNGRRRRAATGETTAPAPAARAGRTPRLRTPLPLPHGPGTFTVEPDGTLVFADGSCLAVVRVDAFLNLSALGPYDQERVCREFGALVHGLAHAQPLQAVIESTPTAPADAIAGLRALVTTADPDLSGVAADTLAWVEGEVARTHVPDLAGYALVAPAPERKGGLAGLVEEFRDQMGVQRRGVDAVDRRGLDAAVDDTLTQLKASDLPARRLRRADVLAFLWRAANPGTPSPPPVALAAACDAGVLAAALTPAYWRERRRHVEHGVSDDGTPAMYSCTLYFLGSKELTNPGTFADLIAIECNARLSWHLRGLDNLRERGRVLRKRKAFATSVRRAYEKKRLPSLDDEDNKAEAEGLAQELHSAEEGLALSTVVLTLHARTPEELDTARRRALSLIGTRLGIQPAKGPGYQGPLWRASLPLGQNTARRRAKRWHTAVIGNGLPYLAHNPGTPTGFPVGFTTRGHELVLLDLIHQTLSTSVMIVTGAQGMGKTLWLLRCALWARYRGQRVTLIARADHFRPFVELCGGTYIEPGAEGHADPPIINLWDLPAGMRLAKKVDFLIAAHEIMLCNPGQELDDEVRGVLDRAIQAVYRARGVVAGEERPLRRDDAPLERELVAHVEGLSKEEGLTARKQELLEKLHATLLQYVSDPVYGAGRYAHLVDRPTRVDVADDVLCWNLDGLAPRLYALTLFTVTNAMAHRAKSTFDATRGHSAEFLAIDEGWFLSEFMKAGAELTNWAKRSRHIGLILAFASQQLSEAIRPGTKPIFDAASLKCVFRLADVRETEDTATWAARTLQCSVEEAHTLTGLHEGQMMMFRQAKDGSRRRGLVGVMAPPLEYWAFTTETWTDVPKRNAAVARLGSVAAAIRHLAGTEA